MTRRRLLVSGAVVLLATLVVTATALWLVLPSLARWALVRQVAAFVVKDPAGLKEPMVRVVIRALFDLCRPEIAKLPKPPPRK